MSKKYYHAENSNRLIRGGAFAFHFEPYRMFGGTWQGTYATDDANRQAALAELIGSPRNAIKEITQAEYEACTKKKEPMASETYNPLIPPTPPESRLVEGNAVVVETPGTDLSPPVPTSDPLEKADDALDVGDATQTDPPKPPE